MSSKSLQDILREQDSPLAALSCLAGYVESMHSEVLELVQKVEDLEQPLVDVVSWDEWSGETPPLTEDWQPDPEVERKLAQAQEELAGNESDEESRALRAHILLLEDQLVPPKPDPHVDTTERAKISLEGDEAIVELPPVSADKKFTREEFARDALHLNEVFDWDAIEAYGRGGPLWLYYGNRDFVMGLSSDFKRMLVNDVAEQSPTEAHEMARDILKDLDPGGPDQTIEDWKRAHGVQ